MESLAQYKLEYEDVIPLQLITRKGGKDSKMSKQTKVTEKASKEYSKTRGEHLKDIVIAILIVGVIAFVAGVHYSDNKTAQMQSAVKAMQSQTAQAPEVKK